MKKISMWAALAGAAILVYVIAHMKLAVLLSQLRAVRMALPIILGLSFCRLLLQTKAWLQVLRNEGSRVAPGELMGIRLASQSLAYLTMLGALISEPMKIKLLQAPVDKAVTATLVDDAIYWATSSLSGLVGCACIVLLTPHTGRFVASTVMILVFSGFLIFITRQVPTLSLICDRFGGKEPSWLRRAASVERAVREYRAEQPTLVKKMFAIDLLCQLLLTFEVIAVLGCLQISIHPTTALTIDGLTRMTKMLSCWIPARLGADEAGAISAFSVAGLSPVLGLTLALTRRSRDLLWAVCGMAWLALRSRNSSQTISEDQLLNHGEAPL
jgi:Lysylphosphatidylglycerol synthase TM region